MTSRHDFTDNPAPAGASPPGQGRSELTKLIDPPRIPVGLPPIVQFVEGSLYNESQTVQNVGSKMARYANKDGVVSIALVYLCWITGLGSHHTVTHAIEVMRSLGIIEKHPGQGGHDRKSNTYRFLGEKSQWKPPKAIPPDTHLPSALRRSLEENEALAQENDHLRAQIEELRARLALLTNGHTAVTDGDETAPTDSHEPGDSEASDRPIRHSEVSDGGGDPAPETALHSYGDSDTDSSAGTSGAIGHSGVSDGPGLGEGETPSDSYETQGSDEAARDSASTGHSEVTDAPDEGQQYLARRERVQALVMEQRAYYARSFRGGLLSAIEYFARSDENEADLIRQVEVLKAGQEPPKSGSGPPRERDATSVPMTASGRPEVENCPDCGSPYTTFNGEVRCPDCTYLQRRREREA